MDFVPTLNHVSVGVRDVAQAKAFYDKVFSALGIACLEEYPGIVGYGRQLPEFWIHTPLDGKVASVGNGTHVAFFARSKEEVHGFYEAALAAGGTDDGAPGPRPLYGDLYYGCFVRDLDGNKMEAVHWQGAYPGSTTQA